MAFDSDPSTAYYIIGTAQVIEDEPEPKQGRLIVFKYAENNKMLQVSEREVKGAPYCMAAYNGKLLVGINNSLKLYEFATSDNQLVLLGSHADNVFIVHLKCKNDFILIGDMMKSCAVLTYRPETSSFECVARDHSPAWLNSIEIIDDDHFLMCDGFQNMTCLRKDRYSFISLYFGILLIYLLSIIIWQWTIERGRTQVVADPRSHSHRRAHKHFPTRLAWYASAVERVVGRARDRQYFVGQCERIDTLV